MTRGKTNILPLSPTARKGKSPAAHTRATREYARRRCLPRTPSLAASHTEPRCRRLPRRASQPQPTMPAPGRRPPAQRRLPCRASPPQPNPNRGCPIACSSASTQDVAHPRSPSVAAPDLRAGFVRVWSSSGWHQILPPLLVRWAPLRVLSFVLGKSPPCS